MEGKEVSLKSKKGSVEESGSTAKLSTKSAALAKETLQKINADPKYKGHISLKRLVEKLVEDHRNDVVEELILERERSQEWFEAEHKRCAPEIPFWDWLKREISRGRSRTRIKSEGQNQSAVKDI